MILFNRKKEDEDPPSQDAAEGQGEKKRARKKKKEPPKPWGKKERYLVVVVLLITTVASAVLAASAREWKLPGMPRIKLPSLNFEKTVVFEKENNNVVVTSDELTTREIVNEIEELTQDLSGVYGLYVYELLNDNSYGSMQDDIFQAASLIKLPVMTALLQEAEKGNINLDAKYVLRDEDKVGGAGSLQYEDAGYEVTYREILELMGQQSDNTAFNIVVNRLGAKKINAEIERIGMTHTSIDENETSPRDIGIFFQKLWQGKLTDSEGKNMLLDNLTNTAYEEWITSGVPTDIQVIHKFGREVHVVNDAGIIRAKNPFVLVIMSKGVVEKEADQIIPEIAGVIYDFESE